MYRINILILVITSFLVNSCATDPISIIKNGALNEFPTVSIGDALEASFTNTSWETFQTDKNQTIVEFKGTVGRELAKNYEQDLILELLPDSELENFLDIWDEKILDEYKQLDELNRLLFFAEYSNVFALTSNILELLPDIEPENLLDNIWGKKILDEYKELDDELSFAEYSNLLALSSNIFDIIEYAYAVESKEFKKTIRDKMLLDGKKGSIQFTFNKDGKRFNINYFNFNEVGYEDLASYIFE